MKVTVETLTDEMVRSLSDIHDDWVDWPNRMRLRLGWYIWDALNSHNDFDRNLAREVCCNAINARASKESP